MSPIFSLIKLTIMKILYALQQLPEYLLCKAKAAVSSCSADIKIAIVYNKKKNFFKSSNGEYSSPKVKLYFFKKRVKHGVVGY